MKPMRVYIDTSVFGGCFDDEFADPSRRFFAAVRAKQIVALVSDVALGEVASAPEPVRDLLADTIRRGIERLDSTEAAAELQDAYLQAGVVTSRFADDALHVAQATLARADAIVSWNFKHLVNPLRVQGYNEVNRARGHASIVVVTPTEIVKVLEEDDE